MTSKHVTVRYQLGGLTIEARVPPDLAQGQVLPLAASSRAAADYRFSLQRYYSDEKELDLETLNARIANGSSGQQLDESSFIKVITTHWLGYIDILAHQLWLLTSQEFAGRAYADILSRYLLHAIPKHKGIFFHCAGVHIAGQTLLFLAPSGTGKTTLARLAYEKGFHVLSDETVFVSWDTAEFVAHTTPLGRLSSGPLSGPIDGVFFPHQGKTFEAQPLSAPRAVIAAWNDSYYRMKGTSNADERRYIVNRWFDLFSSVPCYEMQFTRDFDEWDRLLALAAHG